MNKLHPGFQYIDRKEIYMTGIKDIVLAGDTGCTIFNEESQKVLSRILEIETDLFIILGDLVAAGQEKEFNEVIDFCNKRVNVPIFTLCGNHDVPGYPIFFGLSSYALILDRMVIVILNNATAPFKKEDLDFLKSVLDKHPQKKFLVLFHIPPPTDLAASCMKPEEWVQLKRITDKYKQQIEAIFSGHIHGFHEYYRDGYHIFITGGGGAKLSHLEKDNLKSHHAIKVELKDEQPAGFEIIPIII